MNDYSLQALYSVQGLVCVILDYGSGAVSRIATALSVNGATVFVVGPQGEQAEIASKTGKIIFIEADTAERGSIKEAVDTIHSQTSYINLLLCDSKLYSSQFQLEKPSGEESIFDIQKTLWEMDFESWSKQFELNIATVYFTAVAFLPLLHHGNQAITNYTSQIILISSSDPKAQVNFAESTINAACNGLSKHLSSYLTELKIRVNTITLGNIVCSDEHGVTVAEKRRMTKRLQAARDREIAALGVFLASPSGVCLNGVSLNPTSHS